MNDSDITPPSARSNKAEVATTFHTEDASEIRGTVRVAPAVLIQLIETSVSNIPGVVELVTRKRRRNDEDQRAGKSFDDGKVRVTVDGDQIDADIAVAIESGYNVERVTNAIRERIGVAGGRMLGMTVRSINIYVDNIVDPAD